MLACPVRQCGLPLVTGPRTASCANGHSFDRARSGYWNLLQPQDRRSRSAGDSPEAVAARRRLHEHGYFLPFHAALAKRLQLSPEDVVLDVGCGEGSCLGYLSELSSCSAVGVDLTQGSIEAAARRFPQCTWVVANADRQLPILTASCSHILSITARRNPAEFRRVLVPGGRILVAVPAPNDLIELRGAGKSRRDVVLGEFPAPFELVEEANFIWSLPVDETALADLQLAIYRPRGNAQPHEVTFSLDFFEFTIP